MCHHISPKRLLHPSGHKQVQFARMSITTKCSCHHFKRKFLAIYLCPFIWADLDSSWSTHSLLLVTRLKAVTFYRILPVHHVTHSNIYMYSYKSHGWYKLLLALTYSCPLCAVAQSSGPANVIMIRNELLLAICEILESSDSLQNKE